MYPCTILFLIPLEMQPVTVFKVAKTITCHCWNKDRTRFELIELVNLVEIALATRNSNDILVYDTWKSSKFEDWKLVHTLTGVGINEN